ncbi:MAG: recombinase family protein [Gemmatimonadaceae bacterium]
MTVKRPKAYSYLRFSTPEQSKGDSFRRQAKLATDYAAQKGLELDERLTFHDLGVSAFRGDNVETGQLAAFHEAVRVGLVEKGSYLLVESLDRLSRQFARRAFRALEDICDAGIVVVTLSDNREYTQESLNSDPTSLLMSILIFMRANEESATKARRLKASWENKRANAGNKTMTGACPGWLTLDRNAGKFIVIPERAAVVQRIFHETLQGCSPHSLALAFNVEGVPMFGRGKHWHRSYIIKILDNPAVIGTMTPHTSDYVGGKMKRKPLTPVFNYFPSVVDAETFERVRQLRRSKRSPMRGQHSGKEVSNILGGLGRCARCGATMTRMNKGKGLTQWHYLVCTAAKTGAGCLYELLRYGQVEDAFLRNVEYLVGTAPAGDNGKQIDKDMAMIERNLEGLETMWEKARTSLVRAPSAALAAHIRDVEIERDTLVEQRDELLERRAETSGRLVQSKLSELRDAATAEPLNRTLVNSLLRQTISSVDVDSENGLLLFHWKHGGESELVFAMPKEEKKVRPELTTGAEDRKRSRTEKRVAR